jgi:heme/copper-type cytochrome/quinol oxidase subunit 3
MGMPRRVYTYPDLPQWGTFNMISTVGAFIMALSLLFFLLNIAWSLKSGERAGDNPWNAWTLEWATTSPPSPHNFDKVPPIRGRRPLYELAEGKTGPIAKLKAYDKGAVAMWAFIASETAFFAILIITYVLFNLGHKDAAQLLDVKTTGMFSVALFASSATIHLSEKAMASGNSSGFRMWLAATIILGAIFIGGQASEYRHLFADGLTVNASLFASTFFTLTGFHGLHVTLGLVGLSIILGLAFFGGDFKGKHSSAFKALSLYWHFVDVVWIVVFSVVYLRNLS